MLKQHLQFVGEKQGSFAVRLGVSGPFLSQIISGHRRPSLDLAVRIARLTGGAVPVESWVPESAAPEGDAGDPS
jgi:DNA-binding transcriptional regulator YdaS (Cro superfamily)